MEKTLPKSDNFFKTACYFEAALIIMAVFLGWLANIDPFEYLQFSEKSVFYGLLGTLPLFLIFIAMENMSIEAIHEIRKMLLETIAPYLYRHHWTDLLILAIIAGVSEEVLFRGVIQPWMENSWGMQVGLLVSSVLFGLLHAITPLYAFLAMCVSIYLGLFLDYGGERNLLTPIVVHAMYDFLVFLAIMKTYKNSIVVDNNTEN